MSNKNKIFIFIMALPVLFSGFLWYLGYIYSHTQYKFEGLGKERAGRYEVRRRCVFAPYLRDDKLIISYKPEVRLIGHMKDGKVYYSRNLSPYADRKYINNFNFDDLRDLIKKYVSGAKKEKYLKDIKFLEFPYRIQKIISFVPWDVYVFVGIWLSFLVVFRRKALTTFFLWGWYFVWMTTARCGFHALYNGEAGLGWFILNVFRYSHIYYETLGMFQLGIGILLMVPVIHVLKFGVNLIINGIPSYFNDVEDSLNFKNKRNNKNSGDVKYQYVQGIKPFEQAVREMGE